MRRHVEPGEDVVDQLVERRIMHSTAAFEWVRM